MFGPSRQEIWKKLSAEIGAQYVDKGLWKGDRVEATHGEWTVTLDTYTVSTGKSVMHFTRMRAPFVNPDSFRFTIYRNGIFSDLGRLLGMQDIEIGHPPFDERFIVKSNDEAKIRLLLSDHRLRSLVEAQPDIHLTVKDDEGWFGVRFPDGVDELYFQVHGTIKDIERLKQLYDLFGEVLEGLCRIGSAYRRDPEVRV